MDDPTDGVQDTEYADPRNHGNNQHFIIKTVAVATRGEVVPLGSGVASLEQNDGGNPGPGNDEVGIENAPQGGVILSDENVIEASENNVMFDSVMDTANNKASDYVTDSHNVVVETAKKNQETLNSDSDDQCVVEETKGKGQDEIQVYIFTCPFCLVRFKEAEELKSHLKSHIEVKPTQQEDSSTTYQCGECEICFDNTKLLESHLASHESKSELNFFQCDFCEKGYSTRPSLVSHMKVHNANQCNVCNKYFRNAEHLQEHQEEHASVNKTVDPVAEDQMRQNAPNMATQSLNMVTQSPNMVAQSPDMVTHSSNLDTQSPNMVTQNPNTGTSSPNMVTRSQTSKNQCSYCQKTFKKPCKLVSHLRTHTGEKPYACSHCPRTFAQKYSMVYHERIHSGEKPYECNECGKRFSHPASRNEHIKIHSTVKAYSCLHCGQKFKSRSGLVSHQFSHSDIKNVKCRDCSKGFKNTKYLNKHIKACHSSFKTSHKCGVCGDTFATNRRLLSHMFIHEQDGSLKPDEIDVEDAANSSEILPDGDADSMGSQNIDMVENRSQSDVADTLTKSEDIDITSEYKTLETKSTDTDALTNSDNSGAEADSPSTKPPPRRGRRYKCNYCVKVFSRPCLLERHQRTHTGEKPYICEHCPKAFARKDGLILHERCHTGERPYKCTDCNKSYKSSSGLKEHIKSMKCERNAESKVTLEDKPEIVYKCRICYKDFISRRFLSAHIKTHGSNNKKMNLESSGDENMTIHTKDSDFASKRRKIESKPTQDNPPVSDENIMTMGQRDAEDGTLSELKDVDKCKYCKKQFGTAALLDIHERDHVRTTGKKSHRCGFCGSTFEKECRRITHERIHTGEKPFQCKTCSKSFARKDALKKHEYIHSNERPFSCKFCDKTFKIRASLTEHISQHSVTEGSYECQQCNKSFKRAQHLRDHEAVHTACIIKSGKIKAYLCQYCQQSFRRVKHLSNHMKTMHDGNDKKSDHNEEDERHEMGKDKSDEDESVGEEEDNDEDFIPESLINNRRYYKCNRCDVKKRTINAVELHERTHTEERPYLCPNCDKTFVREDALKCHKNDHVKQTVFDCDLCTKTFKTKWHLQFHQKSHEEKQVKCPVCGETFPNRVLFKEHKKSHSVELWRYFYCTECPKSFGHKKSLADHIERCHRDTSRIKCDHCGETFVNQGWFQKHMYVMHHEEVFAEQQLRVQGFPDLASMEMTMQEHNVHTRSDQIQTKDNYTIPAKDNLLSFNVQSTMDCIQTLTELSSLHPETLPANQDNNGNPIMSNSDADKAASGDTNEKQKSELKWFSCKWCPKKYSKPSVLKIHERSHTGEKPYLCQECGKGFRISSGLKAHEERHQGMRKHTCTECPKSYANASALQEHLDAHKGIKRYKCLECPKSFRQQQSLREHLDVHKGFRKYQCEDCPRSFSQRRSWRTHMRTHGKVVPLLGK